jgi:hypothetical protein
MSRVLRVHKALGCSDPQLLFLEVLHDGRFVDEMIRIVYECPEVLRHFKESWNAFLEMLHDRAPIFNEVMDRVVASFDDAVAVDIRPGSVFDARVGRLLVHVMNRYPGKFVFILGDKTCFDDFDVVTAVLQIKKI